MVTIIKLWRKFDIPLESLITGATLRRKRRTDKAINGVTGHAKKRTNKDALYCAAHVPGALPMLLNIRIPSWSS